MMGTEKSKGLITDFTEGNITRQLLMFAAPLFLSNLLQIVYNMVDMAIVGRVLGVSGISAVSVGGDVSTFLTFFVMGISNAGQVIIAKLIGEDQNEKIGRFIGTMFSVLGAAAIVLSITCLILRRQILNLMNTPEEAYGAALGYATICMAGLIFIYGYNAVSAVLRGMGDSAHPFVFISVAVVLNAALDLLFVVFMGMGAAGAALATVISQGTSFISCGIFLWRRRAEYGLDIKAAYFIEPDRELLRMLILLGIPMALKNTSVQFSKLFVNSWINSYGVTVSAFAGIANKIVSMSNLTSNSFNTAGASMIGQNIGAGKYERVKLTIFAVFRQTVFCAGVLTLLFFLFPNQIYGLFTDDAKVVAIGIQYLPIAVIVFFGSAARSGMNALINGSGKSAVNFATAFLDGIVMRIGLALLFGLVLGMKHYGFWLGDALSGFTPFIIGAVFYISGKWK